MKLPMLFGHEIKQTDMTGVFTLLAVLFIGYLLCVWFERWAKKDLKK